ncbi:MAG: tripartite tricarboxylate transporter substrate binding protein [Hylemonella sp.]|nr:tripartite tricarboxylate transporter substrate binding protein [Hylemonella sp.]
MTHITANWQRHPLLGTLLVSLAVAPSLVHAAWPDDQPIRIIVPQAAGGTNDTVARLVGSELAKSLKQSVVVENRPGASGAIGMQHAAQSKPDGYTLALASDSAALLDALRPTANWKFKRDLVGLAMVGDQPISLAVPAASAFKTLGDVATAARAKPGKLAYGTSGVGSSQHVVGEWWAKVAEVKLIHVPYKGGGQASTDLVGNQLPVAVLGLAPMLAQHKNGKVRVLAVTSPRRNPTLPDVPTFTEAGYPQISLTQWAGLVAPTGLPEPIARRLAEEISRIVQMPEVQKKLIDGGITPQAMSGAAFDKFLKDTVTHWEQLVPTLNIKLVD